MKIRCENGNWTVQSKYWNDNIKVRNSSIVMENGKLESVDFSKTIIEFGGFATSRAGNFKLNINWKNHFRYHAPIRHIIATIAHELTHYYDWRFNFKKNWILWTDPKFDFTKEELAYKVEYIVCKILFIKPI